MKKIFVLFISFVLLISCATNKKLPSFEDEYKNAKNVNELIRDKKYISYQSNMYNERIQGDLSCFYYQGYLFDVPVKESEIGAMLVETNYDLKINSFPRSKSYQAEIMWKCIDDFIKKTGMKNGDYFNIEIHNFGTLERSDRFIRGELQVNDVAYIYITGRLNDSDTVQGFIRRK
jgi:hypothetical protein